MYPIVSGNTLSVHGDSDVNTPAARTVTYVVADRRVEGLRGVVERDVERRECASIAPRAAIGSASRARRARESRVTRERAARGRGRRAHGVDECGASGRRTKRVAE
jgi:hypothetical protein